MNELNDKIKPIDNTFILLSQLHQVNSILSVNPTSPDAPFKTEINGLNVEFQKNQSAPKYTTYSIMFKDEEKKDLFEINMVWSQPLFEMPTSSISIKLDGQNVEDPKMIKRMLSAVSFDEVLIKVDNQLKDTIKEKEILAAQPRKPTPELVSDVLDRINKIRPSTQKEENNFSYKG